MTSEFKRWHTWREASSRISRSSSNSLPWSTNNNNYRFKVRSEENNLVMLFSKSDQHCCLLMELCCVFVILNVATRGWRAPTFEIRLRTWIPRIKKHNIPKMDPLIPCSHTYREGQVFLHQSCSTHTAQEGQLFLQLDDSLRGQWC